MLFKEVAPIVILFTLIISVLIITRIKILKVSSMDGKIAILGTIFGFLLTLLNVIYSNNYLISIGPLLTIGSLLYLKYQDKLLVNNISLNLSLDKKILKVIQIVYWICILISLTSYYMSEYQDRPLIFFASISIAVGCLGLEILSRNFDDCSQPYVLIFKILLLSLIIRLSAYFISPYPVGSDPWRHADLIKDISIYRSISYLPAEQEYYSHYPMMHLYASTINFISNFSTKNVMSIIGLILAVSTIFVYLSVKKITNDVQLALFSMLLINFSDFHIKWSIQIIAMSFGIIIYTIIIYLLIEQEGRKNTFFKIFTILNICIITWTHTASTFILMISLISLYIGALIYDNMPFNRHKNVKLSLNITLCLFTILLLVLHWTDPTYPFFRGLMRGLISSLFYDAKFLGRDTVSNIGDSWSSIFDILGFLILIFFGIIGSLHSLSKEYQTKIKVPLIVMLIVLFSIMFVFPVMGLRNIMPYRWPAFIYTTFILFSGIGILKITDIFKDKLYKTVFITTLLIFFSFFMITNSVANMDSPFYGKSLNQKMIWTESEIDMLININNSYDNIILTDTQTRENIFMTYLNRGKVDDYLISPTGVFDWEYMENKLLIWRKISLYRPLQVQASSKNPDMLLGFAFKSNLDNKYHAIYDTGGAKVYLGLQK